MEIRGQILSWLRRRRERARRIEADAGMLFHEFGPDAYAEARLMQRRAKSADETQYWRDVAMAAARIAKKRIGLDIATRMTVEADFGDRSESAGTTLEPRKVDPIDELKRLVGDAETDPRIAITGGSFKIVAGGLWAADSADG
jgi:hypothetical protein